MPVPNFSPGEVLTAGAMDSIGLWLVKSQTIGAGVSSVPVTGAFSADYDRYKVFVIGGTASITIDLRLTLGSAVTGYYGFLTYGTYNTNTVQGFGQNNTAFWGYAGTGSTDTLSANFELDNPFNAKRTMITAQNAVPVATTGAGSVFSGFLNDNNSYTSFTLSAGANFSGGTIYVYGYKKQKAMTRPLIQIDDIGTTREMTDEEYAQYEADNANHVALFDAEQLR